VNNEPPKTFLITGAAGFIGSHLFNRLTLEPNSRVVGIDSFSNYYSVDFKKSRVSNFKTSNAVFLEMDLADRENCKEVIAKFRPTHVIHLAAQAGIRLPIEENGRYVKENLLSFVNIASECISSEVKNFLYASSSSVYGDSSKIPFSESESSLKPVSFYGLTKLFNEMAIANLAPTGVTKFRGMRFFTVYGPWGRPDMAYFKLISKGLLGAEFKLNGDGSVKRDFTYVDDVITSILRLTLELENREEGFQDVVNIGGGKPVSMLDLISTIEDNIGTKLNIKFGEPDKSDLKVTNASTEYQFKLIGNVPETSLAEGVSKTINWAKSPLVAESLLNWSLGHE